MRSLLCSEDDIDQVLGLFVINGVDCPVTNIFDIHGEPTVDITKTSAIVVQLPDGRWYTDNATPKQIKPLH